MRRGILIALALVAALLGVACGGEPGSGPTTTPPPAPTTEPTEPDGGEEEALAVWPEDNRADLEAAAESPEPWRDEPETTAVRFAERVLGWSGATTEADPGAAACRGTSCMVVVRPDGQARVRLDLEQFANDVWSVVYVSDPEATETPLSVSIRDGRVQIGFDLGEATEAEVRVGYGGQETAHTYTQSPFEAGPFDLDFTPEGAGHLLILWRDDAGAVFDAHGTPLPEGDFAAG